MYPFVLLCDFECDFTDHYKTHYQLGPEEPIHLAGCDLANSASDETLSHDDFKSRIASLNENGQPGHHGCFPEYVKHGGTKLNQWLILLMTRIWTFACDLPVIDRVGRLVPIPKKSNTASVDTTRPICLLTTIYKLYVVLLFHKVRDRVKEFVSWTQAGFIKGHSCGNSIWIMRRVAERAIEFNVPIYCALVDYKGAFDALNRGDQPLVGCLACSCHQPWFVVCYASTSMRGRWFLSTIRMALNSIVERCKARLSSFTELFHRGSGVH